MLTYKLHFIRCAVTRANLEGRYIGRTESPVCEEGFRQLDALMESGRYPAVSKVYTSPLSRCVQTAEYLYPDTALERVNDLMELDMGAFEDRLYDDLKQDQDFLAWMKDASQNPPPGGEDAQAFLLRLAGAVQSIFYDMMDSGVREAAVVTHAGVIMTILSAIGLPKAPMEQWEMAPGCGYTLLMTPQMWMRDRCGEIYGRIPAGDEEEDSFAPLWEEV